MELEDIVTKVNKDRLKKVKEVKLCEINDLPFKYMVPQKVEYPHVKVGLGSCINNSKVERVGHFNRYVRANDLF